MSESRREALKAANAALRERVNEVVINYPTGQLDLHWRHGAVASYPFQWPEGREERAPSRKKSTAKER